MQARGSLTEGLWGVGTVYQFTLFPYTLKKFQIMAFLRDKRLINEHRLLEKLKAKGSLTDYSWEVMATGEVVIQVPGQRNVS